MKKSRFSEQQIAFMRLTDNRWQGGKTRVILGIATFEYAALLDGEGAKARAAWHATNRQTVTDSDVLRFVMNERNCCHRRHKGRGSSANEAIKSHSSRKDRF